MIMRKVVVAGVGSTKYGKLSGTARDIALTAAKQAIKSSSIELKDIQAGFVANVFSFTESQGHLGPMVMSGLGISHIPASTIESACSSGASAFREAYINVGAGVYDVALVVGTEKVSHLDTSTATTVFTYGSDYLFEGSGGASFPGLYAAVARAHATRYGTTQEQMALVAVKNHDHGLLNPKAHFHKKISVDEVLKSPIVASPLKLFDSCPFSDGAAALIVCSREFAGKHGIDDVIVVLGSGRAGGTGALHNRDDLTTMRSTVLASREAFEQTDLAPKDIDFAEVHDAFTIAEIIAMEDVGFTEKGKAVEMIEINETRLTGRLPINPSGGLKSKGHPVGATGVGQIVEVYEQLTGKAGLRQVKDARIALTHNVGAVGASCAVHIFGKN